MSEKFKFRLMPRSLGLRIVMAVGLIAEVFFVTLLMVLDILPANYTFAILAALVAVDVILVLLINGSKKTNLMRVTGLIIFMLLMNLLLVGDFYIYSTYDTMKKISKYRATWEIYNVITLRGGKYNQIGDINGEKVKVLDLESKQLTEAMERLVTKEDVSYEKSANLISLGQELLPAKGGKNDVVIMATTPQYKTLNKQIAGFKTSTQSIYKIKVKKRSDDSTKRIDVRVDSFNVLISGKDIWGKLKSDKSGLSDVNMVMTVNPKTKHVLLTSIPRDSYVPLHSYGAKDKLTHTGIYGEEETKKTIEDFLGIDINYGITVNFSMLVDLIDAIGGIDVYSEYEFDSAIHDCHYKKGWNHLKGKPALYFARERKAFSDGDMQRNKNQQKVLKATIEKVTSSKVIMTRYNSILNSVEDKMYTDLSNKDLRMLAQLTLRTMNTDWTVETVNITGGTGGAPCFSMGNQNLSCVFPSEESVEEAKTAIHDIMYPVDNTIQKPSDENKTENTKDGSTESTTEGAAEQETTTEETTSDQVQ